MKATDWQHDLFDLMANEHIKLVIEGEVGEVDAMLSIYRRGQWEDVAYVIDAESLDDAMVDLLEQEKAP